VASSSPQDPFDFAQGRLGDGSDDGWHAQAQLERVFLGHRPHRSAHGQTRWVRPQFLSSCALWWVAASSAAWGWFLSSRKNAIPKACVPRRAAALRGGCHPVPTRTQECGTLPTSLTVPPQRLLSAAHDCAWYVLISGRPAAIMIGGGRRLRTAKALLRSAADRVGRSQAESERTDADSELCH
jgi:hypothetical protein